MNKDIDCLASALRKIFNCELALKFGAKDCGMNAVLFLLNCNEFLYAIDISKKLQISRARLSKLIAKLIFKKYAICLIDEQDKRKSKIFITEKGKEYIEHENYTFYSKISTLYDKIGLKGVKNIKSLANDIEEL